jgi:hypothetical protein
MTRRCLWGALLTAALPLFCQTSPNKKIEQFVRFTLDESPEQIVRAMGRPDHIDDSSPRYLSWQYESPPDEANDDNTAPAWFFCLKSENRQLLSVTRNFDKPQDIDDVFPAAQTTVHYWPAKDKPQYSVRMRRLSGETILLAMGTAKPGDRTTQLILIRRSALKTFLPWLDEQLVR